GFDPVPVRLLVCPRGHGRDRAPQVVQPSSDGRRGKLCPAVGVGFWHPYKYPSVSHSRDVVQEEAVREGLRGLYGGVCVNRLVSVRHCERCTPECKRRHRTRLLCSESC